MDAPPQSGRLLSLPDLAAQLPGLSAEGAAVRSVGRHDPDLSPLSPRSDTPRCNAHRIMSVDLS